MGSDYRSHWLNLKKMAFSQNNTGDFRDKKIWSACMRIRHNVGYHYFSIKNFSDGFELYKNRQKNKAKIYCSLGETMDGTRFYFSDAAVQVKCESLSELCGTTPNEIVSSMKSLNFGIRSFLECFFKISSGEIVVNREARRKLK